MSVKDAKDTRLELDSVVLTGKRGLPDLTLQNATAGAVSLIYELGADTLAVVSTAAGVNDSAIGFQAQDILGAIQTPLFLTGDGVTIDGSLIINGTPFVPYVTPTIEQVLTAGSNAGGVLGVTGLATVNSVNGGFSGRVDVANGAPATQGLWLGGTRFIPPFVQAADIPNTAAPLACSPVQFDVYTFPTLPGAGRYLASAVCTIVPVDPVLFPISRVKLSMFAGAGEFDNPATEISLSTDTIKSYSANVSALLSFDGTEQFIVGLLVDSILGAGVTYNITSPSTVSLTYVQSL